MKNNILKSIFVTILLLLGVSHTAWGYEFKQGTTIYVDFTKVEDPNSKGNGVNYPMVNKSELDHDGNGRGQIKTITFTSNVTWQEGGCFIKTQVGDWACVDFVAPTNGQNCALVSSDGKSYTWTTYNPASGGTIPKQIKGSFDSWNTHDFKESGGLYSYTYNNLSANTSYEFVVVPQNGSDFKNKNITKANPSAVLEQSGSNATIQTDVAGDYKFTWDPATNTITVTYPSPCLNIYVQGRFKVRTAKGGSTWKYTGSKDGDWTTNSTNIRFEYEEATGYYKLNTYCSVGELSAQVSGTNYFFHFKEGDTEYGAMADNVKPELESKKSDIQSGSKNFLFTKDDDSKGDNVVLYLDWGNKKFWYAVDASTFTVTFNTNGHGSEVVPQKVTSGEKANEPDDPTEDGFTFGGWYTEKECTNKYVFSTAVTQDITLYAKWTENKYTVTINVDPAEGGSVSTPSVNVGIETSETITATPNTGYDFVNWTASTNKITIANENAATTTVTATAAGTVTANFKKKTYTVTFNANGHGLATQAQNNIVHGGTANKPADPTEDGFTFGGWYTNAQCTGDAYDFSTAVTQDITLYAKWTIDYSAKTYYYYDEKGEWKDANAKELMKLTQYAFAELESSYLYDNNHNNNKFKIFDSNTKSSWDGATEATHLVANCEKIAESLEDADLKNKLKGNITLVCDDSDYKNAQYNVNSINGASFFVVLYYPNTTLNTSNDYVLAATTTLPDAEKYNVSFGVVGNTGGTITAKSGSSTITSGQLVSHATFTATPAPGYAVEGWYSDPEGNNNKKIDAAGTKTTYSQIITETNSTVYVKFEKAYAIYYKFNDQKWDNNYYAYIFTNEVWHSDNGVQPKENRSECGQMSKYNDSVYYYKFTKSADYTRFAFSWGDHSNADYFNNIDAVYRSDFHKEMPVFIAERGQSPSVTKGKYYNQGVWMKFNDTDPGYNLCLTKDNGNTWSESYRFTAAKAGDYISTVNVVLTKNVTYQFWVKNDKPYYFKTGGGTCEPTKHQFTFYTYDNGGSPITITPTITGTYTFQLNLANGKVEIDVLYPTTQYRLVYVEKEKDGNQNIVKFHPSHIIKQRAGGTAEAPLYDTISMHVRPKKLTWNNETNKYDTVLNTYTCEVWLQEFKNDGNSMDWERIKTIDTQECPSITTNGVYNFILRQSADEATIEPTAIHPYTGRYYIRTDASDGGWNNYKQLSNYFYYTEYSRVYRGFDHYYCRWAQKTNLKYTIACDYSYCVSDTLAQEDHEPHSSYTDGNGTLKYDANVRFMWNSFDNTLDRAYIAGAEKNLHLLSKEGIFNSEGTEGKTDLVLSDQQNWVYRADVQAKTNTRIKLRATPYNDAENYAWFRGKAGTGNIETDFNDDDSEKLIEGSGENKYPIRIIYDFKTDHLICAWVPKDTTITGTTVINTDLMIIRKENGPAAQLRFDPASSQLGSVTTAFCVVTLTKERLGDKDLTPQQRGIFYVSFPFDVRLADVFGCGKYGVDYVLGYYDGATRAREGWWSDSGTFWCYVLDPTNFVLEKGVGYILALDYDKIVREQFQHKNTEVNIYFPSANTEPMDITGELTEVVVPEHECTIQRENRDIYDSNWNLIGVPSWANVDKFGIRQHVQNNQTSFLYDYDAKENAWTVSTAKDTTFQSMYAYMVQWAGTINWQTTPPTLTPSALQARQNAPAAEGDEEATAIEQYTFRLTLNRGEQPLDHTYIRLQESNVTTDFDLNYDMTKILNSGANLYSLVGTQQIQCAANVQPLQEEAQTISIPLGVVADQDGLYTFSMPDGTEGMNVSIADSESGTVHNLSLGDYQTALTAGTHEGRFALEIQPRQEVSTGCEQTDAAGKRLRKVLINGNLYILRDGKAYTATGNEL